MRGPIVISGPLDDSVTMVPHILHLNLLWLVVVVGMAVGTGGRRGRGFVVSMRRGVYFEN